LWMAGNKAPIKETEKSQTPWWPLGHQGQGNRAMNDSNKSRHGWGLVVHAWNPAPRRVKQKDLKFEESLGYTARLCLQKQNKNSTW
jgi:hypothetical protein